MSSSKWFRVGATRRTETFPVCDQYTLQGDAFARAILNDGDVPVTLENALGNMRVMELFKKDALRDDALKTC